MSSSAWPPFLPTAPSVLALGLLGAGGRIPAGPVSREVSFRITSLTLSSAGHTIQLSSEEGQLKSPGCSAERPKERPGHVPLPAGL